ncbi:P-loop containing nucleoside triphosphate hydrolase protein [Blastocladiella britannica]|nr:P-loop containing nucleoside triphosphate hydrolase protein [Blastocladiella britannica]
MEVTLSAMQLPPSPASAVTVSSPVAIDGPARQYLRNHLLDLNLVSLDQQFSLTLHGVPILLSLAAATTAPPTRSTASPIRLTASTAVNVEVVTTTSDPVAASGSTLTTKPQQQHPIAGLDGPLSELRRLVSSALFRSHEYSALGLRPPRGALLYGPPGTGKTLLARAIAQETDCHLILVNGPEIVSKFYGETEEKIRAIFDQARAKAPTLVFLDEIDALCPSRDSSPSELEKRAVATLLTLLDGASLSGSSPNHDRVFVIGATNRANALDAAMRRPGRLDVEVEVGVPTPTARTAILQSCLATVRRHSVTADAARAVAEGMHGFVGADVAVVVREAGVQAVQRALAGGHGPESVCLDATDLADAAKRVVPSAMRESVVQVPDVKWADIGGNEHIKQALKESVEWPLKRADDFIRFGITPPKGILLYGPPGCSKTLVAKALANESKLNFLAVKGPELYSKWVGDSEKAIYQVFRKARAAAPSIIFFDEIDAIAGKRSQGDGQSVSDRVLSQLLNELDGVEPLVNVTVVAATNRPDLIDPALLRPGRIDRILYVGPPDQEARREILKLNTRTTPIAADVDLDQLAADLDGCSGAEVASVCQAAALCALERDLDAEVVDARDFGQALAGLARRITPEMLRFYDRYRSASRLTSLG